MTFLQFFLGNITKARKRQFVAGLGGYAPYIDRFFLFEYGLEDFFRRVGFDNVVLPQLGLTPEKPTNLIEGLTSEAKEFIDVHFATEVALYEQIKDQYRDTGPR